jgi:hypothetical protein
MLLTGWHLGAAISTGIHEQKKKGGKQPPEDFQIEAYCFFAGADFPFP